MGRLLTSDNHQRYHTENAKLSQCILNSLYVFQEYTESIFLWLSKHTPEVFKRVRTKIKKVSVHRDYGDVSLLEWLYFHKVVAKYPKEIQNCPGSTENTLKEDKSENTPRGSCRIWKLSHLGDFSTRSESRPATYSVSDTYLFTEIGKFAESGSGSSLLLNTVRLQSGSRPRFIVKKLGEIYNWEILVDPIRIR
jgi:hypothetical protein